MATAVVDDLVLPGDGLSGVSRPWRDRWVVAVAVVFLLGFAVRLPHLGDAPDKFQTMRQYYGQLTSRWLADELGAPTNHRAVDRANFEQVGVLEAPVIPAVSAVVFRVTGHENWWTPRLVSIGAWMVGAWFLLRLVLDLTRSRRAALVAAVAFLFFPFGLSLSRSIQPDALMVSALVIAWWAMVRAHRSGRTRHVVVAGLLGGMAVVCKATAGMLLVPVVGALQVRRLGWRGAMRSRSSWLLAVLCVLPGALFYALTAATGSGLDGLTAGRFVAALLGRTVFWQGWWSMTASVVGPLGIVLAVGAVSRLRGDARAVFVAALGGYVAFGIVFDYRIMTHDYYSAPLLPLIALSLGVCIDELWRWWVDRSIGSQLTGTVVASSLVGLAMMTAGPIRSFAPGVDRSTTRAVQGVGRLVRHSTRVITLGPFYGYPIRLDGGVSGTNWPNPGDIVLDRLEGRPAPNAHDRLAGLRHDGARWFVVSDRPPRSTYGDVLDELDRYPVAGRFGDVIVYDLR